MVGAGLMGRWHSQAAQRAGARVVGVVDSDSHRARRLAASLSTASAASVADLEQSVQVDVVHICTPAATHAALIQAALDRGCHVICEKPLVTPAGELRQILARARALRLRIVPVHQFPFQAGAAWLIANLQLLGELRRIEFSFCTAGADTATRIGAGQLVRELLPHPLSMLNACGIAVSELDWNSTVAAPGEVQIGALAGRILIRVSISISARPTEACAAFYGTSGTVRVDFFHGFVTHRTGVPSRRDKLARPFADGAQLFAVATRNAVRRALRREWAYPGLASLFSAVYLSLADNEAPPIDTAAMLDVYNAVDLIESTLGAHS